jgi:hypothetical protein
MKVLPIIALWLLVSIALVGCDDGHLRGSVAPSKDGKTYLAVVDDNGGACGPILLDGKVWPYKMGEPGPVPPGRHRIECGGWIEFDIPRGVVVKFDYWGP